MDEKSILRLIDRKIDEVEEGIKSADFSDRPYWKDRKNRLEELREEIRVIVGEEDK